MLIKSLLAFFCLLLSSQVLALNIQDLWVAGNPAKSEAAFEAAKVRASELEKLLLDTQIARTFSMRRDFEKARSLLSQMIPQLDLSPELRVRYDLELGRTYCSGTHQQKLVSPSDRQKSRELYLQAAQHAQSNRLDDLQIDALHMMAFVEIDPTEQLVWSRKALAVARLSDEAPAKRWEGALLNNIGYALKETQHFEAALEAFKESRVAFSRDGRMAQVHIADWMIAHTLRLQNKLDEALLAQHALEKTLAAIGKKDRYVFEELAILYRLKGDSSRANDYDAKAKSD
jgi:tetratricopeptide (TPR) repeat protein